MSSANSAYADDDSDDENAGVYGGFVRNRSNYNPARRRFRNRIKDRDERLNRLDSELERQRRRFEKEKIRSED